MSVCPYRSPNTFLPPRDRRHRNDEVRRGHHHPKKHREQSPHRQQQVSHQGDQHQLPHALLGGSGTLQLGSAERKGERAAEERKGEAEEQRELGDLLQLRHLQVLDVGDDEEREEHHAVHGVGALGYGESWTGQQLDQRQGRRGHDEHRQGFERGCLFQFQIIVLEKSL